MSILKEKFFKKIKPYVRCKRTKNGDIKIEIDTPPEPLLTKMLDFKMKCIRCERVNNPFRMRRAPSLRKTATAKHIYYACSCKKNSGCSRGNAARDEYEAVGKHFHVPPRKP